MKVIFLDFDGVLNNASFIQQQRLEKETNLSDVEKLDPNAIELVNEILNESDGKVVVSSTWRKLRSVNRLQELLTDAGMEGEVIDKTPQISFSNRGGEIFDWILDNQEELHSFAIIDDFGQMDPLNGRLVKTNSRTGIQPHHVDKAIELLETPWSMDELEESELDGDFE